MMRLFSWRSRWIMRLFAAFPLAAILTVPVVNAASQTERLQRNPLWPKNFVVQPTKSAAEVPARFYRAIQSRHYHEAEQLLTSRAKPSYEDMGHMKYFADLQYLTITRLYDVTSQAGLLRRNTDGYAAIKVYIGEVKATSRNPVYQAQLDSSKYHRFVIDKTTASSPWQLDDDEALPTGFAQTLWHL